MLQCALLWISVAPPPACLHDCVPGSASSRHTKAFKVGHMTTCANLTNGEWKILGSYRGTPCGDHVSHKQLSMYPSYRPSWRYCRALLNFVFSLFSLKFLFFFSFSPFFHFFNFCHFRHLFHLKQKKIPTLAKTARFARRNVRKPRRRPPSGPGSTLPFFEQMWPAPKAFSSLRFCTSETLIRVVQKF